MIRTLSHGILRLMGWRLELNLPDVPKYVIAGGPHTSNWDFVIAMLARGATGLRFKWIGKHTIFRWPFGALLRRIGGIPAIRESSHDLVSQVVAVFDAHDALIVAMAPEGTRKRTDYWRTGFYYIALGAGVPIAIAYLDFAKKTLGVATSIEPTGDIEADFGRIREILRDKRGKYPEKESVIRPRPRSS